MSKQAVANAVRPCRGALVLSLGALVTSCYERSVGAHPRIRIPGDLSKTIHAATVWSDRRADRRRSCRCRRRPPRCCTPSAPAAQVKAVDKFSDYPAGTPMTSLDGNSPNVEAIASYQPDLVVVSQESPGLDQQLKALGIPVAVRPGGHRPEPGVPAVRPAGRGHRPCVPGERRGGHDQGTDRADRAQHAEARLIRETYYYELEQTYYSVTSSTFIGQVLGLLGLKSIADSAQGAAASGGYPQLNGEFILKANPGLHLVGRHHLLRAIGGDGGRPTRVVDPGGREGRPSPRSERRHRVALGPEDRGPLSKMSSTEIKQHRREPVVVSDTDREGTDDLMRSRRVAAVGPADPRRPVW